MSGTDNFQAFLAQHRQEKARVKALRTGASQPATTSPAGSAGAAAAAAAAVSALGAEPHWQLKVHSNDPRDRAAAAATHQAAASASAASPERGGGAFQIGGMSFVPSETHTPPPPVAERGGIINSVISSLATPMSVNKQPQGGFSTPQDSSTLLKSMNSALARLKNKGTAEGGSMSAMEELQELAQLANMAATTGPPSAQKTATTQQATALLDRGLTEQIARHQQQLDALYAPDSYLPDHVRHQESSRLTTELHTMREQQQRIRSANPQPYTPAPVQPQYGVPPVPGGTISQPTPTGTPMNETDRLKQQLESMRQQLDGMHSQQQPGQGTPARSETEELMTEIERMRARLRHVDEGKEDQGPALSRDVEIQPDPAAAYLPKTPGYEPHGYGYNDGGYSTGGDMNMAPPQVLNYTQQGSTYSPRSYATRGGGQFDEVALGESHLQGGGGQDPLRPRALIGAEDRLQNAYSRLSLVCKGCIVHGGILFFPGIFSPYGFPCWGSALPLMIFGAVYLYYRAPEIAIPVNPSGFNHSKIWLGVGIVQSILLLIAGGFAGRGADVVKNLIQTPVCGAIDDCSALFQPNQYYVDPSGTIYTNYTGQDVPVDCMLPEDYQAAYDACAVLSMCRDGALAVGECQGINGINIFTACYCIISSIIMLCVCLWLYTLLDVRIQEHNQLLERDIKDLEEEFEYADLSPWACLCLFFDDWGRGGRYQNSGQFPDTSRMPREMNMNISQIQSVHSMHSMQRQNEAQHGDQLTAEALEARILTPGRAPPMNYASHTPMRGEPVNTYSVRSPQGQAYY